MKIKYLAIYDYADFLGRIIFPLPIEVSIGEEFWVDLDDPEIGFEEGM